MSDQHITNNIPSMEEEAYKLLNIVLNSDGSITRLNPLPIAPTTPDIDLTADSSSTLIAFSKDIPLNPIINTFIRLFRPRHHLPSDGKLPLIIYFHGGGFVIASATYPVFHESCNRMAAKIPALVASVEYRLAPEHRLPAAYHDSIEALNWVKNQAISSIEPWMRDYCDFSRVFIMGSSAGGNMVYHVTLRSLDLDLSPIKIVGLIMHQPFFGGVARTESQLKFINDKILPLHDTDLIWSMALPKGSDRGHEYCDPLVGGSHDEKIGELPVSLVRGYAGDPLIDKQKEFVKMLEARGVHVISQFLDEGYHGVEDFDPTFAEIMDNDIRDFICSIGVDK